MRNKRRRLEIATNCAYIRIQRPGPSLLLAISNYCLATLRGFYKRAFCRILEHCVCWQRHNDSIASVTYCAITLSRILLLLNDPLCHPSFCTSLPPALNQTMLGAVGCQDPQCTFPKWDLTVRRSARLWHHNI